MRTETPNETDALHERAVFLAPSESLTLFVNYRNYRKGAEPVGLSTGSTLFVSLLSKSPRRFRALVITKQVTHGCPFCMRQTVSPSKIIKLMNKENNKEKKVTWCRAQRVPSTKIIFLVSKPPGFL